MCNAWFYRRFILHVFQLFLFGDAARALVVRPMIACWTLLPQRHEKCHARSQQLQCSAQIVDVLLLNLPPCPNCDMFCCVAYAADVGFGAAGVEEAAGGGLPHPYRGNGRPGGEANVRNRRDVRLPIEAHAALRHAL